MSRTRLEIRVSSPESAPTHPGRPGLSFFFDRRMDGCFLIALLDADRGQSAAPCTSRAHIHAVTQSLRPQTNVCGSLCCSCAFISHAWSLFMVSRASKRFRALQTDFINNEHHITEQRCFDIAASVQILWIDLFARLSRYYDCACDAAFQERIPCFRKLVRMPSEVVSDAFFLSQCLCLALLEDPFVFRT